MTAMSDLDRVPLTPADQARLRALRGMKRFATGLLVAMAVVYVLARAGEDGGGSWIGYVRATAEAAMVGALADWFAVTALFRHPLGLPIPHTAIIPRRKDEIGRGLGEFVQSNFLAGPVLAEKLRSLSIGAQIGGWLADPAHAATLGDSIGRSVGAGAEVLRDDDVRPAVAAAVTRRVRALEAAPLAARLLDAAVEGGHHHAAVDAALADTLGLLERNREQLRSRLESQSPWWVPDAVDERVFAKVYDGVRAFVTEVAADPEHEVRRQLDERARLLVEELRSSPEMARRAEALKDQLLEHPAFQEWASTLWTDLKQGVVAASAEPTSELRLRLQAGIVELGRRLQSDPALAAKVDRWVEEAVVHLLDRYRDEVADLVSGTVARWDADDASRRIELQVGHDLQYIRINGTVVGGLAGLVIHTVGTALLG